MSVTLCAVCNGIFAGGQISKQDQPHHRNPDDFLGAAKNGCYICRVITTSPSWNSVKVQKPQNEAVWSIFPLLGSPSGWLRLTIDCLGDEPEGDSESGSDDLVEPMDEYQLLAPAWGFTLQPVDGKILVTP